MTRPTYVFAGKQCQLQEYQHNPSRSYINQSIPRCNACRKPRTTYSNCQHCKVEMDKLRDEIKAKGKKKMDVKPLNEKIGDVELLAVCNGCSRMGHKWVWCPYKPYCYLCALSHNVGDIKQCLALQSTYIIFENIWAMPRDDGNPKEYSIWQLLSNHTKSSNDKTSNSVPVSLQRDVPLSLPSESKLPSKTKPGLTTATADQLYENTIPEGGHAADYTQAHVKMTIQTQMMMRWVANNYSRWC